MAVSGRPPLDLTPRPVEAPPPGRRPGTRGRMLRTLGLIALVLVASGFVLARGLGDATLFFYNVDEAVAKRVELDDRRFRLQGTVVDGTVSRTAVGADFTLSHEGVDAAVRHQGDLPQLFQPGIPLVLEGTWRGELFASDRMLVKHSEVYTAANPERVDDYDQAPAGGEP